MKCPECNETMIEHDDEMLCTQCLQIAKPEKPSLAKQIVWWVAVFLAAVVVSYVVVSFS